MGDGWRKSVGLMKSGRGSGLRVRVCGFRLEVLRGAHDSFPAPLLSVRGVSSAVGKLVGQQKQEADSSAALRNENKGKQPNDDENGK